MVDEMKKAFLLYDDDGTGKITFKNLERVAQELGEAMSPEELQELITEADADGDGQLSEVSNSPRDSRSAVRALTYAPRCPFVCYAFSVGCVVLRPRGQQHRHFWTTCSVCCSQSYLLQAEFIAVMAEQGLC